MVSVKYAREPTPLEHFVIELLYRVYGRSFIVYRPTGEHLYGYSL